MESLKKKNLVSSVREGQKFQRTPQNFSVPPYSKTFFSELSKQVPKKHPTYSPLIPITKSFQPNTKFRQPTTSPKTPEKFTQRISIQVPVKLPYESRKTLGFPSQGLEESLKVVGKYDYEVTPSLLEIQVPLKRAMRKRDWVQRARRNISKDFSNFINASNGIAVRPSAFRYRYYLGKGNNSPAVKKCFSSRWWWIPVNEHQLKSANLVWTQGLRSEYSNSIATLHKVPFKVDESSLGKSVECRVIYESKTKTESTVDISSLGFDLVTKSEHYSGLKDREIWDAQETKTQNRFECFFELADKKYLYKNMKEYYSALGENVFDYLPLTFHVESPQDPEFKEFQNYLERNQSTTWILKPGENTNRGNGIKICNSLEQIKEELRNNPYPKTGEHTFIIQEYLANPLLINRRKFDIRCFALLTSVNGVTQGYFYKEGYLRTSCREYNPHNILDPFIHLTNDAVQKKAEDYGKFEKGNKVSYSDFQKYLETKTDYQVDFTAEVLPNIKKMVQDTFKAVYHKVNVNNRAHQFEIFGYDFILDDTLQPWLIEVNSNPCLEFSSSILSRIIPAMLENAFIIAVDPVFPEPPNHKKSFLSSELIKENKFELIFNEVNTN